MTKDKLKAPVKPARPQKPYEPSKDKKTNEHRINIDHLFLGTKYYDENGAEISEEQYNFDYNDDEHFNDGGETENIELIPSLKQLLELVPPGTNTNDIFIDLSLGYDSGRNYDCRPFQNIVLFYTTPFDYEKELKQYQKDLEKYVSDTKYYDEVILKQYQKDLAKYKEEKQIDNFAKKKASLEAQLAALNNA